MNEATTSALLLQRLFSKSAALRELAARVARNGVTPLGRAADSVAALALAYLSAFEGKSIIWVTARLDEAERARRDWSTFLGAEVDEFPPWESLFESDSEPDPDIYRQRAQVIDALASNRRVAVVAPVQALLQPISKANARNDQRLVLRAGDSLPIDNLARQLADAGFRRFPQVARPGDFAVRGGIFDIFPREAQHPYRLEYLGNEIETVRSISQEDQRSRDEVGLVALALEPRSAYFIRGFTGKETTLFDRLPKDVLLAITNPRDLYERTSSLIGQWAARREAQIAEKFWARAAKLSRLELESLVPEVGKQALTLPVASVDEFTGALDHVVEGIKRQVEAGRDVCVYFRQQAEVERFQEILDEHQVGAGCRPVRGELGRGFRWEEPGGAIFLSGSAILGRTRTLARRATKVLPTRAVESFIELAEGDLVVHVSHGIGRYLGVRDLNEGRRRGEHLVIEYREGVQLLVPADRIDLVQKYIGGGRGAPFLDRLGSRTWARKRAQVEEDVHDLAAEMIEVQALRAERDGFAFPPDNAWQREFEAAFPFQETRDQLSSMESIRRDLESARPMDRLICGDVGYGKTELAMRAAFKTVQAKRQVAVLVPTTVLAQQHLVTFHDRMAEFPVRIECLSRLRSRAEQHEILRKARDGEVDILIGTHRLLSNDVSFADIGLIVIDEEQRFGVVHKEKLKQLRRMVDVLTLTATPIPRTLHMALMGVRDISSLHEAPQGRSAIHTEVTRFDPQRFREIILRELNRDGQVFYLHNRVASIKACRHELEQLVPEARMIEVHGQMNDDELEDRMLGFLEKRYNVLVCTTIIESGLDIPSANTLIVERADRFGLAELHQLRGRVGRGQHQAYAYLLVSEDRPISIDATRRLEAIEEFSQLGAGFQIAMRDLEIRGAGNLLGKEQSGHIAAVGYDLYCKLLKNAVDKLRGTPSREPPDVEIAIPGDYRIPQEYVGEVAQRLRVYRSIATALDVTAVAELEESLTDLYGAPPAEARELLRLQQLRIVFGRIGVRKAWLENGWLFLAGDLDAMTTQLRKKSWETLRPPGEATLATRPRTGARLERFEQVVIAALADFGD
ncbi:MAG: transcription-repair coupling factor [Planctomycetota bacterium]